MAKAKTNYDADSITVLEGRDAVRKRPLMYIGSTGETGLHHLVYETVKHSIDEWLAGYVDMIEVIIHPDNSITVADNGRGIPIEGYGPRGRFTAEEIFTTLYAGGKFLSNRYKAIGNRYGIGISCVNFLSEWLNLEIWREGQAYQMEFRAGISVAPLKKIGWKKTERHGIRITFKPEPAIFETTTYSFEKLSERLREKAFLNKGLRIFLKDEREKPEKSHEFYYKDGIVEFVRNLDKNHRSVPGSPLYFETVSDDLSIEIALQFNDSGDEKVYSFANDLNTAGGGTHLLGFRSSLTQSIDAYRKSSGLGKTLKAPLSFDDVCAGGLSAVVSVEMFRPYFEWEPLCKLTSDVKDHVEAFLSEKMEDFFEQNPVVAKKIARQAVKAARARENNIKQSEKL